VRISRCACGSVEIEASGEPITSAVCYCDTCQEGSNQIAAATGAAPIADSDGGTEYVLYRKDRVDYSKGRELLRDYKLEEKSTTNRVVATCCNSAMVMRFDDGKHWVPMYRARFQGDKPPLEFRICTKFKPQTMDIPMDVPSSEMYPGNFMWKLLSSRIAMLLGG
jgi:hypothetical protein